MKRDQLVKLRKIAGFTQLQMANKLGKARSTYTQYETGKSKISFEDVVKLKTILKCHDDSVYM